MKSYDIFDKDGTFIGIRDADSPAEAIKNDNDAARDQGLTPAAATAEERIEKITR